MITLDMSSSSHEELIIKSGKYLAQLLTTDKTLQPVADKLRQMKTGDSSQGITEIAAMNIDHGAVQYLMQWNSHGGWWYVIYSAWYQLTFGEDGHE